MQDAVVLANSLYELRDLKQESIQKALQDYKEERYAYVKLQYKSSKMNAIILYGQVIFGLQLFFITTRSLSFWIVLTIKQSTFWCCGLFLSRR
jgi:2-polyprenyl-6-methoxyphenol hydroxylase-like FAD-dependent oxidoreductase